MKMQDALFRPCLLHGAAAAALLLADYTARAHPYASGITNNAGTISFVLNESADSVKVAFDNYTSTNNLGALAAGVQSFALGVHTNYAVIVSKAGVGIPFQISADSNPQLNFAGPEGVAVNRNPKTSNFGRIYVVNSNPDVVTVQGGGSTRTTGQGVYLLNADQSDAVGQGDTALTAGLTVDNAVSSAYIYVPYRINIGPDDTVYLTDGRSLISGTPASRAEAGSGVWAAAPDFSSGQGLFPWGSTTEFGGVPGRPYVTGSLATGDLVLYALEWDLAPWQTVWKYTIGGQASLPYNTLPTALCNAGISSVNTVGADMAFNPAMTRLYTMEYRGTPGTASGTGIPLYIWDATNNFVNLWQSYTVLGSQDPFAYCYSLDISPDGQKMVTMNSALGQIEVIKLTNGIPDISTLVCIDNSMTALTRAGWGASVRHIAYDIADNIYASSLGSGLVRVYSPGQATTCITANDWTGTNGTFSITKSDVSPRALVTSAQDPNLDLQGSLTVAEYYGGSYGTLWLGGVPFVNGNARVGGNASPDANIPNFGSSQDAQNLAKISASDNWQANFSFNVPCTAGHSYKLQMLFHDNYYALQGKRRFNVTVGGVRLATALDLALAGANMANPADVVFTYSFTNTDGSPLPIELGQVTDNPMISALVLKDTTPGVSLAPVITANPASLTNLAGATVSFQGAALGTPPVSYQWQAGPIGSGTYTNLINGGRFSGVNSNVLTIANIKSTDQLDYVLRAVNSVNSALSTPATLAVTPLGNVTSVTAPADLGLGVGTVVVAEYYGNDLGPLTIGSTTFRDNQARMGNNGYTAGFTAPANTPYFGSSQDATNLALISAMDAWGSTAATLDFTVPTVAGRNYLLKLLLHDNWFNTVGARVFSVNAGPLGSSLSQLGPQAIDLVNFGDFMTQPADLMLTLGVTNYNGTPIQVQMVGSVQNPMVSAVILQDVSSGTVPPMVTMDPQPFVTLYSGHTTNLSAVVGGSALVYQWQVSTDGGSTWNNLSDSAGHVSGSTTPTLSLTVSSALPYAMYHLVAHNTASTVTTAASSVTVMTGPPQILTGQDLRSSQAFRVGQTLQLSVGLDGDMPYTCVWKSSSDGGATWNPVVNGGRVSGATSNVLSILNAQTNDAAMYQLFVENDQTGGTPVTSVQDNVSVLFGAASFADTGIGWTMNGSLVGGPPVIVNNSYTLTDDQNNENDSAFYSAPVYVGAFHAGFTYQNYGGPEGGVAADGACWVLQNDPSGASYLGAGGGGMGYTDLAGPSFALSFNLYAYDSLARGAPGWTYCTNGAAPAAGVNPFRNCSPVSLYNTTPIAVDLLYVNHQLTLTMTQGTAVFQNVIPNIDLPTLLGANTAYVGLTGADGGAHSYQIASNFFFEPIVPLKSQLTSTNTVLLTWEKNSGFMLQSTADLSSGTWQDVPAGTVAGQAVVPLSSGKQFYRLFSPLP